MDVLQKASAPNKMQGYRRIDVTYEAVINEFNYIEQLYKGFSGPIGIKLKKLVSGYIVYF